MEGCFVLRELQKELEHVGGHNVGRSVEMKHIPWLLAKDRSPSVLLSLNLSEGARLHLTVRLIAQTNRQNVSFISILLIIH